MGFIDKLERKFGRYIPEGITKVLLAGQVVSFILIYARPDFAPYFYLTARQVLSGEIWRLAVVLFTPLSGSLLFVALAWYFFYFFSTMLENHWGSFRYLLYVLISYIATIIFALLFPDAIITNLYIYTGLFLAYTHVFPDMQVLLFFILPIKVKWLGYFAWASLLASFLLGPLELKTQIALSVSNFLLFFYADILPGIRSVFGGTTSRKKTSLIKEKPLHVCSVCGQNEIDNPYMEIRYCNKCNPMTCYCGDHIAKHQHKRLVN